MYEHYIFFTSWPLNVTILFLQESHVTQLRPKKKKINDEKIQRNQLI